MAGRNRRLLLNKRAFGLGLTPGRILGLPGLTPGFTPGFPGPGFTVGRVAGLAGASIDGIAEADVNSLMTDLVRLSNFSSFIT